MPVPSAALIASLSARVWVDTARGGMEVYGVILVTHPPDGDAREIERQMRGAAAALGLSRSPSIVPSIGARLTVAGGETRLRFDGTEQQMCLGVPGHYGVALSALGRGLLAVGLDPLDVSATAVETDAYIDRVTRAGRVYLGSASVRTAGP